MNNYLAVCVLVLLTARTFAAPEAGSCPTRDLDASRVAVAGGSITEIIYALGAQDKIVAVDRTSNFPQAATRLPSIGYVRAVSAEGLLALNPTLVLGEHDMGPGEVVEQVRKAGLPVVVLPEVHTVQGIYEKVACIAQIMDAQANAVAKLRDAMDGMVHQLQVDKGGERPRVGILLSLADGVPTGGGRDTSAHGVLTMAGANNVFAGFSGWKPISLESMAESDPEFIVMPVRGIEAAGGREAVLAHPSVRLTKAGKNARIIAVDGMTLLGFGPRTLVAARDLAQQFKPQGDPG